MSPKVLKRTNLMISKLEKRLKPAAGRMVSDAERRRIKTQIESLKKSRPKPKPPKKAAPDKSTDPSKGSGRTGESYTIPKKKQAEITKLMDEERKRIATEKRRREEYNERKDKIAAENRNSGLPAETKATMERRAKAYQDRKTALEAQKKKQPDGSAQQKKTSESINKWAEELKKVLRKIRGEK